MRLLKSFLITQFIFSFLFARSQTLTDSLFHPDSLRRVVEVLASDSLKGRFTGTPENYKAALFIAEEFKNAGLSYVTGNNGYFMKVKPAWYNVVGAIAGKSKAGQIIIFSAHYDHIGTEETNPFESSEGNAPVERGDNIFNGANDNASGVAAVISLAKYFKTVGNNERTLLFVAYTGEELGLLGSKYFSDNCVPDSIVAVINIEMIGRSDSKKVRPYITGQEYSDLRKILNKNYLAYGDKSEKEFFKIDPYFKSLLFTRSDNYPFALKGVPAHSIMLTSPDDRFYHNLNDEPWTLDYTKMKKVIEGIAYGVNGLVDGSNTPTRVKGLE